MAVIQDHHAFDAQLHRVREVLFLVGLLALIVGGAIFYLIGGRGLLRSHRLALQRATLDGLTDLPNLRAFEDELTRAIANAARHDEPLTLAVIDLDDFKFSNDRHGHAHGDGLLRRLAQVLRDGRSGDRAYRIGGDEFALLLPYTDVEGSRTLARRLAQHASEAGLKISIGVSSVRSGLAPDLVRAEADAALYEAKRAGGNQTVHFEDIREQTNVTSAKGRAAVHALLEERRLTTLFQPIWNLDTATLLGVEALSRPHPDYDFAGPAEAFDIAEQIGRVHQLDVLCATNALASVPLLPAQSLLFLNICPHTLDLDGDHNEWLIDVVTKAGLAPSQVVIEVTERFGARTASVAKCLRHLHSQGFKIALDDVGTGNQGLEMLRAVNADFVKIDRSIVAAATTEGAARALLIALATFAHQTGAFVIAEGIEDAETLAILRNLGDHLSTFSEDVISGGQGYGLGMHATTINPDFPGELRGPAVATQAA